MKIGDVLTSDVVVVAPETPLKEVAVELSRHQISGMPVVDGRRRVLGVLSEADILRVQAGTVRRRDPHSGLLSRRERLELDVRTAGEAMTSPPITVGPECGVAEAAKLMTERRVNRLPVVDDGGTLIGIVSRADLVRAFIRSDEEIERELREDVVLGILWIDPADVWISVSEGDVRLAGKVETKADAELVEYFASRVPGVLSVHSTLRWRVDSPRPQRSDPRVPVPPGAARR